MSLSFIGPGGSFERRWIVYAMLRDNVQHHLEKGTPSPEFAAMHAIGDALASGEVTVSALSLRSEIERARELLARPIEDFAVSYRTRAVYSFMMQPREAGTLLATDAEWTIPFSTEGAKTLGDLFGTLVEELLRVTEGAKPGDDLKVLDT